MNLPLRCLFLAVSVVCCATACRREETSVSLQPKDSAVEPSTPAAAPDATTPPQQRPQPRFTWSLPSGWEETGPGQMSVASFHIKAGGGEATVNITPLPNLAGKEALIVNMWREQVGATPLSPEDALKALSAVEVAGGKGQLFEISGTSNGKPTKIITAMAQTPGSSWFYKLAGDAAAVDAQKSAFLEFLKTVRMQEAGPAASNSAPGLPAA